MRAVTAAARSPTLPSHAMASVSVATLDKVSRTMRAVSPCCARRRSSNRGSRGAPSRGLPRRACASRRQATNRSRYGAWFAVSCSARPQVAATPTPLARDQHPGYRAPVPQSRRFRSQTVADPVACLESTSFDDNRLTCRQDSAEHVSSPRRCRFDCRAGASTAIHSGMFAAAHASTYRSKRRRSHVRLADRKARAERNRMRCRG